MLVNGEVTSVNTSLVFDKAIFSTKTGAPLERIGFDSDCLFAFLS